jgi:hypothetical protein
MSNIVLQSIQTLENTERKKNLLHKNHTPSTAIAALIFFACHPPATVVRGIYLMDAETVAKALVQYLKQNRTEIKIRVTRSGVRIWIRDRLWDTYSAQAFTYRAYAEEKKLKHERKMHTGLAHLPDIMHAMRWARSLGCDEMRHFDFSFPINERCTKQLIKEIERRLKN